MGLIATLDLGTSYYKAAAFGPAGELLAVHREVPPVAHPRPGWWELEVEAFRATVRRAMAGLAAALPGGLGEVDALSFATQTNSFLLLDDRDQPITPIILWPDSRAVGLAGLDELLSPPDLRGTTGLPAMTYEFLPAKLAWLREHDADVWRRAARLCLLSDYLTWWLTGRHVTGASVAGLTGLVDIHRLQWWPRACERVGVPAWWLPEIVRMGTETGRLRPEAAAELGLPARCHFVVGCLDQYAGAIGVGNVTEGGVSETTGTVLATVRCAHRFSEHLPAEVFQGPGFQAGVYYQMVFGSASANLLEWYRNQLPDCPSFEELDRLAAEVEPGAGGLRVQGGIRMQSVEEVFGCVPDDPGRAVRAIMEAVARALAGQVAALCGQDRPAEIRSGGGAARSRLWLQIKADLLDVPFAAPVCPEPTSLGAAMIGRHVLGGVSWVTLARHWVRMREVCKPDERCVGMYHAE